MKLFQAINYGYIKNIVKGILKGQDQKPDEWGALSLLIKEKQRVDRTLNNMMSALEGGIVSRTTNKRINELENQQDEYSGLFFL